MTSQSTFEILIFTRYPVAGQAKTRLISTLGPTGAARMHRRLTEHIVRRARQVDGARVTICYTGGRSRDFRAWLGRDLNYQAQSEGDLGARLEAGFCAAFARGSERVAALGCDVPDLSLELLEHARDALKQHDVVLGPAVDGGYYLLGLREIQKSLFRKLDWGTEKVADQTKAVARQNHLSLTELMMLTDVDRPDDLSRLHHDPRFADLFSKQPSLSVIIPALNEEHNLGQLLPRLRNEEQVEIIVADGGSRDGTRHVAAWHNVAVVNSSPGRARQMNAAATVAKGRSLLFLHADTLPPLSYPELIHDTLQNPSVVAGVFRFKTNGAGLMMRVMESMTNFRSRFCQWPYGDQGLFMEKRVFEEMHGFAELPIMEDFELVRRLRRRGRIVTLPENAVTSARRWQRFGAIGTTLRNQVMVIGFQLGVAPTRLARYYHGHK